MTIRVWSEGQEHALRGLLLGKTMHTSLSPTLQLAKFYLPNLAFENV